MSNKLIGIVSWFNEKKGFGLIKSDDKEYFAHHSEIKVSNDIFKALYQGENVSFIPSEKDSKLTATEITGIEENKLTCEINNKSFKKEKEKDKENNKKSHGKHSGKDNNKNGKNHKKRPKNTESFKPDHTQPNMRVKFGDSSQETFNDVFCVNDVILVNNFLKQQDKEVFNNLMNEIDICAKENNELWKSWHGDTHLIADDHVAWKENVPTFQNVINDIEKYFNFKTISTRFNLYQNSDDWKPFHHDAAAIKPHIAEKQNTTIAISFGATRETAFQFNDNKCVVSFPLKDNSVYVFGKDVNINWKHGIPQLPKDKFSEEKRISIILWGWMDQV